MAGNFGGSSLAGTSLGLGGFLDDLFGDTEDVAGDTTSATASTTTVDATVIPGTASTPAKQSPGALPKFGTCPADMIDDPLNPQNFCVPSPKKDFTCPRGQIYDYVKQGCVPQSADTMTGATTPTGLACPYGTKLVGNACVSLVGTGVAPIKPSPASTPGATTPTGTNAIAGGSSIPSWVIALGLGGAALLVGTAVYAKTHNGKMPWQKKGR